MTKKIVHLIVILVNVLSIIMILQIDIEIIPLFESRMHSNRIVKINNIISSLSIGIIISSFFYFLLVFIPEFYKRKSLNKIIEVRLRVIVESLNKTTLYLMYKYHLKANINSPKKKDFKDITELNDKLMDFNYEIQNNVDGTYTKFNTGQQRELQYLENERKLVLEKIEDIFKQPNITFANSNLIELLCQLRDCWFYVGVESFLMPLPPQVPAETKRLVLNFSDGVYRYFLLRKKLSNFYKTYDIKVTQENV